MSINCTEKIIVKIPSNNALERQYILDIILGDFLGLTFEVVEHKSYENWEIKLLNGSSLVIEDHFFNKYPNELEYLKYENIPQEINFTQNKFSSEASIPVIFGTTNLIFESSNIICGIDIFASSFFMLTRWEEYANKRRDSHDRFPATQSLAYKNSFLDRPIINEYVKILEKMLFTLDQNLEFKKHTAKTYVSCDVDNPFDYTVDNVKNLTKSLLGDIFKRKDIKEFFYRFRRYIFNKCRNYKYDKNYTFEWYMDVCEKSNLKVAFYFIPENLEKMNGSYDLNDKKIKDLIKYIDVRGHEIGLHGSYQTYQDEEKAIKQYSMLNSTLHNLGINQKIIGNRQHYLRWDASITPQILDSMNLQYDTTGGYADMAGFRYGICYEFTMFDFINRKKLKIKQRPLIVMECSVIAEKYMNLGYTKKTIKTIKDLKKKCHSFNGVFTLLWHNSHFLESGDKEIFKKILSDES